MSSTSKYAEIFSTARLSNYRSTLPRRQSVCAYLLTSASHDRVLMLLAANFQRDGHMALSNQGSRPNYMSTLQKINLPPMPYVQDTHQQWMVSKISIIFQLI